MTSDSPSRQPRRPYRPRALSSPSAAEDVVFNDILSMLGEQLGHRAQSVVDPRTGRRKLKNVTFEFETDARAVHNFAGPSGYSLASNWFTRLLAQLLVANGVTKSQICVFLFVAGGQTPGTGIAEYTQQEITDGLNEIATKKPGARLITRPTVNRAVNKLCEYRWLEQAGNGRIRLNVTLWFQGTSAAQHEVLDEIKARYPEDADPGALFPHQIGPEIVHHQQEFDLSPDLGESQPQTSVRRKRRTG
ncbi:hypothetical protein [Streptomyces sp. NPDC056549]|uniref:hypothetical protein n=1 Tax=Streptomyces sp. NPDC056549 TaxID=3345864 RepID=UPI00369001BB